MNVDEVYEKVSGVESDTLSVQKLEHGIAFFNNGKRCGHYVVVKTKWYLDVNMLYFSEAKRMITIGLK